MNTLTKPLHEEHLNLLSRINALRSAADLVEEGMITATSRKSVLDSYHFLVQDVIPHAQAEDRVIYPVVQLIMGSEHSTATMSRDHEEIASLTQQLGTILKEIVQNTLAMEQANDLRRVLYGLYALIKLHYAKEEEIYMPLLDAHMQPDEARDMFAAFENAENELKIEVQKVKL
jgi:hemerythrin-like domain-containing protein